MTQNEPAFNLVANILYPYVEDAELMAKQIIKSYEEARWQPIETAPKDGSVSQAWEPGRRTPYLIMWWRGGWTFAVEMVPGEMLPDDMASYEPEPGTMCRRLPAPPSLPELNNDW